MHDLVRIKDIATITMGQSPKGETYNSEGIGIPLLNGPTEFGYQYPNCTLFTTDSKRICEINDLIFCVRGSTTGRMNWADKAYSLGRGVCSIKGKTKLLTHYIKYSIDLYLENLLNMAGGSTFPNLSRDDIGNFKIPFSDNAEKIASILSAYDDLIENNNKRIQLLEQMASEIYKEWFVRLRFPNYQETKVENGVPERWRIIKLDEEFNISLGGTPSRKKEEYWNGDIPWINSGKVNELRITKPSELITKLGLNKSATKLLPRKTTLLAITGATLGQVSFLEIDSCTNQSIVGIKDPKNLYDEFIYLAMKVKILDIMNFAVGGAQQHINKKIVEEAEILIADESLMLEFINTIKPKFDLIANLLFKNNLLQQTRDLLLPRLISGKLEV